MHSPTFLRLALSFSLLGCSLLFSGIGGFVDIGILPSLAIDIPTIILVAAIIESIGYFFLVFSHILDVKTVSKISLITIVIPTFSLVLVFKSLSFFFIMYGAIETGISWFHLRKRETLLITVGLALIALSEFLTWIAYLYPSQNILILIPFLMKVTGFFILFLPVINYARKKGVSYNSHIQNTS